MFFASEMLSTSSRGPTLARVSALVEVHVGAWGANDLSVYLGKRSMKLGIPRIPRQDSATLRLGAIPEGGLPERSAEALLVAPLPVAPGPLSGAGARGRATVEGGARGGDMSARSSPTKPQTNQMA